MRKHDLVAMFSALSMGAFGATAHAQDEEPIVEPDEDFTPEPEPAPEPAPVRAPVAQPNATAPKPDADNRPMARSIGFGLGYQLPADVSDVNVTSARIVWSDKLILEPLFELSRRATTVSAGGNDSTNSTLTLGVAAEARYGLWSRSRVTLSGVAGVGFSYRKDAVEGADNDSNTTTLSANWGMGMDLWLKKHWGLSFTLTNPLASFSRTKMQAPGDDPSTSNTFFGLVWDDATLRLMLHAYF